MRAFDGLRGVAVLAVLLFHAQFSHARGGFLGVSAFFTLSGFLITSILVSEHQRHGRLPLRRFWTGRARRLLPAASIALAGVIGYGAFVASADQVRHLRGDVLSAIAYVANWHFLFSGRSYTALFAQPSPLEHFWSLAIEEQFYVVFPLLLLGLWKLGRGRRSIVAIALGAATIASVGLSIANSPHIDRVYYGTDTRAAELLIGALLALVFTWWTGPRTTRGRGALGTAGVGALVLLGWWWATVDQSDAWLYRGGFALHAVVVAVVITAASAPTVVSAGLSLAPLAALGRISYGVYLYHWPIFLWLSPERITLPAPELFLLRVGVTIACATASFVFIEEPIRTGRSLRGAWPRIAAPVAVAALVASVMSVTAAPPPPEINLQPIASTASRPQTAAALPARVADTLAARNTRAAATATPSTGAPAALPPAPAFHRATPPGRPLRVLVVGDSVGITLGRGLALWSNATGRAVVDDAARKWCSLGRALPRIAGIGPSEQGAGCDGWPARWTRLRDRFDPDVVVVLYTIWEVVPRQLPGQDFTGVRDPAHARWQFGEYQAAADVLGAGGAKVVWLTIPCASNAKSGPGSDIALVNNDLIDALPDTRPFVRVLDLDSQVCPDHTFVSSYDGVNDARPDGLHFSDAGARAVANWMMPIIMGDVPPPAPVSIRRAHLQ